MIRRGTPVAVALAAAVLVWLGHSGDASGHALVIESLPRPDEPVPSSFSRIVLRFNSRIEKSLSRVSIVGPNADRVRLRVTADGGPGYLIAPVPTLSPGIYTLEWKVLSTDGHVTEGGFRFRVMPAP